MKVLRKWDVVWIYGRQCLVGFTMRPHTRMPGACVFHTEKEIITSEIVSREGDLVKTFSGSTYLLQGERERRIWKDTNMLSVGGPEDLELRESAKREIQKMPLMQREHLELMPGDSRFEKGV